MGERDGVVGWEVERERARRERQRESETDRERERSGRYREPSDRFSFPHLSPRMFHQNYPEDFTLNFNVAVTSLGI